LAVREDASDAALERAYALLIATRPTAINLKWALDEMMRRFATARAMSASMPPTNARTNRRRGCRDQRGDRRKRLGADRSDATTKKPGEPRECAHACNAGCSATVDWGTATSPIYQAHDKGIPIHVWVERDTPAQSGRLAHAWELGQHGVKHTVIRTIRRPSDAARASRHRDRRHRPCYRARRRVQQDRHISEGACGARQQRAVFDVALPSPTIDFTVVDGVAEIPIEQRSGTRSPQ